MVARSAVTGPSLLSGAGVLGHLPATLRKELLDAYTEILRNYREGRWEPSELNGGKLCEVVYSILDGHVNGSFPVNASKPRNMVDACRALEQAPKSFPRSVRIQIPRMLIALYEVRNNRGVGHVGGDVNPNHMDATCVLAMSKWVLAELVRMFHTLSPPEATEVVDALVERSHPIVWEVGDKLRVLDPSMSMKDRTMVLLYSKNGPVAESDIFEWVEHSNASVYRRDILRKAHKKKLLEYNEAEKTVEISPLGIEYGETSLLD